MTSSRARRTLRRSDDAHAAPLGSETTCTLPQGKLPTLFGEAEHAFESKLVRTMGIHPVSGQHLDGSKVSPFRREDITDEVLA